MSAFAVKEAPNLISPRSRLEHQGPAVHRVVHEQRVFPVDEKLNVGSQNEFDFVSVLHFREQYWLGSLTLLLSLLSSGDTCQLEKLFAFIVNECW